jgi:hypothetical protein
MADFGGMSADQINASMGFGPGGVGAGGQAQLNNIFGNFGQQTDYYSGLGAAYGRGVGEPSGMGSVFDQSAYGQLPVPRQGGGGLLSPTPMAQQGGYTPKTAGYDDSWLYGGASAAQSQPWAQQTTPPQQPENFEDRWDNTRGQYPPTSAVPPPPQQPVTQDWGKYFTELTAPQQQQGLTPKTPGYDDSWMRGGAMSPPSNPNPQALLGYNPAAQQFDPNPFASRFSALPGFQQGTPSQYTASPYTNVQGQTFQPNLPPGFESQFGPDNPGGALNPNQLRPQVMEGRS